MVTHEALFDASRTQRIVSSSVRSLQPQLPANTATALSCSASAPDDPSLLAQGSGLERVGMGHDR